MQAKGTVGEIVERQKRDGAKSIAVFVALLLIVVGALFTGYHNYNLFRKGLGLGGELLAFIPPLMLEGTVLWLMFCQFTWFRDPKQKSVAVVASWAFLIVIAVNTIVDHNLNAGVAEVPDWLRIYSVFMLPATPIAGFMIWKALIDLDPSKRRRDQEAAAAEAETEMMFNARLRARSGTASQKALEDYEHLEDENHARRILAGVSQPLITVNTNGQAPTTLHVEGGEGPKGKKGS